MREPRPDWSPLGVNFKILDEHPYLLYISSPPRGQHAVSLSKYPINKSNCIRYTAEVVPSTYAHDSVMKNSIVQTLWSEEYADLIHWHLLPNFLMDILFSTDSNSKLFHSGGGGGRVVVVKCFHTSILKKLGVSCCVLFNSIDRLNSAQKFNSLSDYKNG